MKYTLKVITYDLLIMREKESKIYIKRKFYKMLKSKIKDKLDSQPISMTK